MGRLSNVRGGGIGIGDFLRLPTPLDSLVSASGREFLRTGFVVPYAAKYAGAVAVAPWLGVKGVRAQLAAISPGNASSEQVVVASNGTTALMNYAASTNDIWRSADLTSWATQALGFSRSSSHCLAVAANGTYIIGRAGGLDIQTSPDGITWTSRSGALGGSPFDIAFNGTTWLAATSTFSTASHIATRVAADPAGTWTVGSTSGAFNALSRLLSNGTGLFVALGANSGNSSIVTSTDGVTWTTRTVPAGFGAGTSTFFDGCWTGQRFIALHDKAVTSGSINTRLAASTDGLTWSAFAEPAQLRNAHAGSDIGASNATSIASDGAGRVVLLGYDASSQSPWIPVAFVSVDHGVTWAPLRLLPHMAGGSQGARTRVRFSGGRFWVAFLSDSGSEAGWGVISITPAQIDSSVPQFVGTIFQWREPNQAGLSPTGTVSYVRIL